jgi:hypothetical protein
MATILPTGETTFFDANGVPLAGGTVEFYIPGTTTPKDTWQNAGQSILNSNPVTLDSAGRAIIYGSGSYRQIVRDSLGNLVWDQVTSEPNSGQVSFGGTSTGTNNAQVLTAAQFSGVDGQVVNFIAGLSNTGPTTISLGGSSPIPIVKNSPAGPVALASGDLVAGNSYFIQYSSALASFQLLLSIAPATPTGEFLRGYISGLILTRNGADPVNDIDFAAGSAGSDGTTPALMTLNSTLTKRIDAPWAVGNNQGGLDTGTVADGVYYCYEIQRSDTGVTDGLLSLSSTAPTMPANYDRKRIIGSFARVSGTNNLPRSYSQQGPTDWVPYTPTFVGLGSPTSVRCRSRRVGGNLEIELQFTAGTSTNVTATVSLGFGGANGPLTVDSYWANATTATGSAVTSIQTAAYFATIAIGGDSVLKFGVQSAGRASVTPVTGAALAALGDSISFRASIPIQGWQ